MSSLNTVVLIGVYGDDETHARSAWTSTSTELNEARIPALLKRLASEGHHTPFEKSMLHFNVTTDVATHIHLLKHRVGVSINAESARYKELKDDKFFVPRDWPEEWQWKLKVHSEMSNKLYHDAIKDLEPIVGRRRAKESARYFKNYGSQIVSDISFNWRSFQHFLSLRTADDAQLEIRELGEEMFKLISELPGNPFKHTIAAFQ